MKRKEFIKNIILGAGGLTVVPVMPGCGKSGEAKPSRPDEIKPEPIETSGKVRLGVITDVHRHYFPYAEERLQKFIDAAEEAKVDFIISIGDFTYPAVKNQPFVDTWNSFSGSKYHVLGNHDMDYSSKQSWLEFVGQTNLGAYYSFDKNGFHFVILDDNFIKSGDNYIPYDTKNYRQYPSDQIAFVSPEQLEWLKEDLDKSDKPTIVFLHQPPNFSVGNGKALTQILDDENKKGKKVLSVFSGHHHKNWCLTKNDIHYIQINSSSYFYVGPSKPKVHDRPGYGADVEKDYPIVPLIAPYDNALYAIVDLDGPNRTLNITGTQADFVPPSPYDLGYYSNPEDQMNPSSNIDSRVLKF